MFVIQYLNFKNRSTIGYNVKCTVTNKFSIINDFINPKLKNV